jgi:hypothetical protein
LANVVFPIPDFPITYICLHTSSIDSIKGVVVPLKDIVPRDKIASSDGFLSVDGIGKYLVVVVARPHGKS